MAAQTHYRDKAALLRRLRKAEGQIRGLQQMIDDDRYCLEVAQQVNAVTAALREFSLLVLEDHLRGVVTEAIGEDEGSATIKEVTTVLRKTLRP